MDYTNRSKLQRHYLIELESEYVADAHRELSKLAGYAEETLRWLERIDGAVDDIAKHLGVEIPYTSRQDEAEEDPARWRYNPAYRVEMLKEKIMEGDNAG